jgi:hypothetical protein
MPTPKIIGLDKLNAQLKKIASVDDKEALLAGAYKLQELSQKSTSLPVDTGFLGLHILQT